MKSNFLVIGASKCASSSLCTLLGDHPDVFMSTPKEPNFFCYDHVYCEGIEWYEKLFGNAEGHIAVGEGTTQYSQHTVWPKCVGRIAEHLPDVKLIYITRHPLDRIESLWLHQLGNQSPSPHDFTRALEADAARLIDSSNYLQEIDAYRDHYPDERIRVEFFEDFKSDPWQVLASCFRFLGVRDDFRPEDANQPRNVTSGKTVESPLLKGWRNVPGNRWLRSLAPTRFKNALKSKMRVPVPARPVWPESTRQWVLEQLEQDTAEFLERYGKPANFWDLREWGRDRE